LLGSKSGGVMSRFSIRKALYSFFVVFTAVSFACNPIILAADLPNPNDITWVNGSGTATVNAATNTVDVTASTISPTIQWNGLSVPTGVTLNYNQLANDSVFTTIGSNGVPFRFDGTINSFVSGSVGGYLWFINPAGIYIGPTASINAAGVLASALNMATTGNPSGLAWSFMRATDANGNPLANGYVINKGKIQVNDGGYVTLLGGAVANEGIIRAPLGKAILASGEKMTLQLDNAGIIH